MVAVGTVALDRWRGRRESREKKGGVGVPRESIRMHSLHVLG